MGKNDMITEWLNYMNTQNELMIEVPQNLEGGLDTAIVRLGALYPAVVIKREGPVLQCLIPNDLDRENIKQEILDAVYRETIFNRTLKIRERIHGA